MQKCKTYAVTAGKGFPMTRLGIRGHAPTPPSILPTGIEGVFKLLPVSLRSPGIARGGGKENIPSFRPGLRARHRFWTRHGISMWGRKSCSVGMVPGRPATNVASPGRRPMEIMSRPNRILLSGCTPHCKHHTRLLLLSISYSCPKCGEVLERRRVRPTSISDRQHLTERCPCGYLMELALTYRPCPGRLA